MDYLNIRSVALALALSTVSIGAVADVIEDFEDGDFAGWTTSGTVAINTTKTIGNYSMRLKGGATAERSFAADGDVTVALAATSLETGNFCDVYVSEDGVNWGSSLITLNKVQDDGTFTTATTSTNGGTTYIRYVQTGSAADYCYADGISIVGAGVPTPSVGASGSGSFGDVLVGDSANNTITVSNTGNANLDVTSISGASAPFSLANDSCSNSSVAPDSNCSFDVVFTPTAEASSAATLTIANNDSNQTLALSGTGTGTPPEPPEPSGDLHVFTGNGNVARTALTISELNGSSLSVLDFSHYSHGVAEIDADNSNAQEPTNTFEGRLVLNSGNATALNFVERTSGRGQAGNYNSPGTLPAFDFEFVQIGSHIIPKTRGLIVSGNIGSPDFQDWNYILEPGRVWNETNDGGYSRVAIPFALQENQANCTHNGMITFAFKDDGSITNAAVQIGGETCLYFQYDLTGLVPASYVQGNVSGAATIIADYEAEVANRIPIKPIAELANDYPAANINVANIGSEQSSAPTTHGVLYNGVHYAAACSTRHGDYPFCEVMSLPSYSTAKTATANFAFALLVKQNSAARNMMVSPNVSECQDGINGTSSIWSDVSVENALDMATGNYRLSSYQGDEGSTAVVNEFFLTFTHDEKIAHSCERYIRKSLPKTHFSYHSSDTYIAGVAMDNYSSGDLFDKLVDEVYKPLNLSPVTYTTVRTEGAVADPYWSHGLTWHSDDMIKLGQFINDRGVINGQQVLDPSIMDDMLVKGGDLGLETYGTESNYLNGVWTYDMGQRSTPLCPVGSWVSYMSGYGGIGVVMFPNGAVYYYVSDSDAYAFGGAEAELHKISNICGN
ncbi:choice-of-anchor D domain-containing protein [Thalassotalea sp. PS06]|uniref:choice-of-anchor D domain-containing protein n=1 Tax=Thalassotalea sp. PS06 TaxID=2594005 RepID=UPI0011634B80|nr:choice-of-anchor D domain-containing protein [Thalassotalea sp. PS06]QDP02760.1 choice-of-anchor D domain-containing protein [Thalassotalea sp. PS06]